jgi:hypothetical protein
MPRNKAPLKTTQSLLLKLITAPEGVEKALQDFSKIVLPIKGDSRLSSVERLDIYANMYFYRIRDALKEDFPAVLKILGEIGFHNLITDYLVRHPSTHYSLRYAGEKLPLFIKKHPFNKKYPFLAELARFEWALLTAFDAPDSETLSSKDLKSISPEEWSRLRFRVVPSFEDLDFSFRVDRLREGVLRGKRSSSLRRERCRLLVWRKNFKVFFRTSEDLEIKTLKKMNGLNPFGRVCHWLEGHVSRTGSAPTLARFLQAWIQEGLLAAL